MSSPIPTAPDWRAQLRRRLVILWPIKSLGTMCWIAAFFSGYFWVLRHPIAAITVMPFTALDRWFAFRPEALVLYVSLWVYVSLPPALVKNFRELFSIGLATLAMSLVGLGIFLIWPTSVPAFEFDVVRYPSLSILKGMDLSANACPSLHVAFALFSAIWLQRLLREVGSPRSVRVLSGLWCAGIVYSTLATRQHVLLDVLAGSVLGVAVAALHLAALRRFEARRPHAPARGAIGRVPGA